LYVNVCFHHLFGVSSPPQMRGIFDFSLTMCRHEFIRAFPLLRLLVDKVNLKVHTPVILFGVSSFSLTVCRPQFIRPRRHLGKCEMPTDHQSLRRVLACQRRAEDEAISRDCHALRARNDRKMPFHRPIT